MDKRRWIKLNNFEYWFEEYQSYRFNLSNYYAIYTEYNTLFSIQYSKYANIDNEAIRNFADYRMYFICG